MVNVGSSSADRGRTGRFGALLAVFLLLFPLVAGAEEGTAQPDALDLTVDLVIAAAETNDEDDQEYLRELANQADPDDPDPWLLVDRLCERGAWIAAKLFAEAGTTPDTKQMPAYVDRLRGADVARKQELAEFRQGVLDGEVASLRPAGTSVPGILVLAMKAEARVQESAGDTGELLLLDAAEKSDRLGWLAEAAYLQTRVASLARARGNLAGANKAVTLLLDLEARRKNEAGTVLATQMQGEIRLDEGEIEQALDIFQQVRSQARDVGLLASVATAWLSTSKAQMAVANLNGAEKSIREALVISVALKDLAGEAVATEALGDLQAFAGDRDDALESYMRALNLREANEDDLGQARNLRAMARQYDLLAELVESKKKLEEAESILERTDDRLAHGDVVVELGDLYTKQGRFPRALQTYERALTQIYPRDATERRGLVKAKIAKVHLNMDDYESAKGALGDAAETFERGGHTDAMAITLNDMAEVCQLVDDGKGGLTCAKGAMDAAVATGDKQGEAEGALNYAIIQLKRRRFNSVGFLIDKALNLFQEVGDYEGYARALVAQGDMFRGKRKYKEAIESYSEAIQQSERNGLAAIVIQARESQAEAQLLAKDPRAAVETIRAAVEWLPQVLSGFSDLQGTIARTKYAPMLAVGLGAALDIDDPEAASFFLESGRAGAFLEMLGSTSEIQDALIPAAVRKRVEMAKAEVDEANQAYQLAQQTGDRRLRMFVLKHLNRAKEEHALAIEKVQAEQKVLADIMYPKADPLAAIQARLSPGEVMVTYGRALLVGPRGKKVDTYVALVTERHHARIVELGPVGPIEDLLALARPKGKGVPVDEGDLLRVRARLVDPLELGMLTSRVVISPDGPIPFIPLSLLFPGLEVCLVPSGTTIGVLRELSVKLGNRGKGVLALADPDYSIGAQTVPRLPASRKEAELLGTELLLGKEATKARLNAALATNPTGRWRSVHLACHGTVNEDDPLRSALIVAADDDDTTGVLEALELYRMQIPSDLVTLSACETGLGKMARGEGALGLVRGFMLAGSPRVVSSLWKVDDDATRELMVKFYEYFNPQDGSSGIGAAKALKKAQDHVKSIEKWEHPWYWAGWVLWGLAD